MMITILIRTVIFYITLTLMMRFMGKRQIGEVQLSEFVCVVLVSEMAALPITDTEIPFMHGFVPLVVITSLEIAIAFLCLKSPLIRRLLDGKPILLVKNGEIIYESLLKSRITPDEIEAQIRLNGYKGIWEIDTVILEQTGKMSVLPKSDPPKVL